MTLQHVARVFDAPGWRSPTQKLVLLEVAYAADRKGIVRKTQSEIAIDTGMSRRTVASWFKEFEEAGIIVKQGHGRYLFFQEAFYEGFEELLRAPSQPLPVQPGAEEELTRLRSIQRPNQAIQYGRDGWPVLRDIED